MRKLLYDVHLSPPDVTETEERFVLDAIRSGWIAPLGPDVDRFEKEMAARVGVEHALALASGTAALHLALLHVGARTGTAVLCPTLTFAATANAIRYTGATPVFVDAAADANVDSALLLEAADALLAEGVRIVAAVPVDLFGRCADYGVLEPGLRDRDIALIEDAAEALGGSSDGRAAGSFGLAAALSFNGNKIMTTSGGGMLLSNDDALIEHARKLSTQAREPVPWYEHRELGFNYRMSNILAALGRAQLSRLDSMIARRRSVRRVYASAFADLDLSLLGGDPGQGDNCWLTTIILGESVPATPTEVVAALGDVGIEARHLWKPMHRQPLYSGARAFLSGVSDHIFDRGLALPSGSTLSEEDLERICNAVRGVVSP